MDFNINIDVMNISWTRAHYENCTRKSLTSFNETWNKHCKTQPKLPQTW